MLKLVEPPPRPGRESGSDDAVATEPESDSHKPRLPVTAEQWAAFQEQLARHARHLASFELDFANRPQPAPEPRVTTLAALSTAGSSPNRDEDDHAVGR